MMASLDTSEYREFEEKRRQWVEWLSGEDRHSIMNQISTMLWNAAVFRVINEARKLAPKADEGGLQLNGMTHRLIDEGFFVSQSNAIRRLVDKGSVAGNRAVSSLYGLLSDMKAHAHLITREHVFHAEGLEYDYEPIRRDYEEYCQEQERAGQGAYPVPARLWWERYEDRHAWLDRLSGVDSSMRQPGDSVSVNCFYRLKRALTVCDNIKLYVDKFIAHAATPGSRTIVNADDLTITLGHLWDAHKAICKVANFISGHILGGSGLGGLAVPQYDHFAYIDRPLVKEEDVHRLEEVWRTYEREIDEWDLWAIDEFQAGER